MAGWYHEHTVSGEPMSLAPPPLREGDTDADVQTIYNYLNFLYQAFANAAGEAIDPSVGQGGDSALTIVDIPGSIVYTPGTDITVDGILVGHIDISFTKPDRVVDIIVFYREVGVPNFKQSYASESPFRLISLKSNTVYQLMLAGQAANGSLGPTSPLTDVDTGTNTDIGIPTEFAVTATYQSAVLTWTAPPSATLLKYEIQRSTDPDFAPLLSSAWSAYVTKFIDDTGTIGVQYYYRVRAADILGNVSPYTAAIAITTLNVPDSSIATTQLADAAVTYAKLQEESASTLLGRGSAAGAGSPQELTLGTGLALSGTVLDTTAILASGTYTPTLTNGANVAASTAYVCQYLRVGSVVTVSGRVDIQATLTGTSTVLRLTLPIASNLTAVQQCAGCAVCTSIASLCAAIHGDTVSDVAVIDYISVGTANDDFFFTFTYQIL